MSALLGVLLGLARGIDRVNGVVGRSVIWLILASTVISGVNAVVRKTLHTSSNAYLEMQWYLYAAAFLLAAGYTLQHNEHVRVDVLISRCSRRTQAWIDLFGFVFFLFPMVTVVLWLSAPFALQAVISGETSGNAGGLIRWPVIVMMPLGFALLLAQGVAEVIKRAAFLRGLIDDPIGSRPESGSVPGSAANAQARTL